MYTIRLFSRVTIQMNCGEVVNETAGIRLAYLAVWFENAWSGKILAFEDIDNLYSPPSGRKKEEKIITT